MEAAIEKCFFCGSQNQGIHFSISFTKVILKYKKSIYICEYAWHQFTNLNFGSSNMALIFRTVLMLPVFEHLMAIFMTKKAI